MKQKILAPVLAAIVFLFVMPVGMSAQGPITRGGTKSGSSVNSSAQKKPVKTTKTAPTTKRNSTSTYILVDDKTSTEGNYPASGDVEVFFVSTNASSWSTWGVPSWCSIEEKSSDSFFLRVQRNPSSAARHDYMEVRTPNGKSARIDIYQAGASSTATPTVNVEDVTISHNQQLSDGLGMIIHVKFTIDNMKDRDARMVAYFYDSNNKQLVDNNDRYSTTGSPSHVATGENFTPKYESSRFNDFQLKIPYSELHQTGLSSRTLKFTLCVWDKSASPSDEIFSEDVYHTFTYNGAEYSGKGATASVQSVDMEYNVWSNGSKGMNVKVKYQVDGLKNKQVTCKLWFYEEDNFTKLDDGDGGQVRAVRTDTSSYDNTLFTTTFFIPYYELNKPRGWSGIITFDVVVYDNNNNILIRNENNRFQYSQN